MKLFILRDGSESGEIGEYGIPQGFWMSIGDRYKLFVQPSIPSSSMIDVFVTPLGPVLVPESADRQNSLNCLLVLDRIDRCSDLENWRKSYLGKVDYAKRESFSALLLIYPGNHFQYKDHMYVWDGDRWHIVALSNWVQASYDIALKMVDKGIGQFVS